MQYQDCRQLLRSSLLDRLLVYRLARSKYGLVLLVAMLAIQGLLPTILCTSVVVSRMWIESIGIRRLVSWCTIIWAYASGYLLWANALVWWELAKEFVLYSPTVMGVFDGPYTVHTEGSTVKIQTPRFTLYIDDRGMRLVGVPMLTDLARVIKLALDQ